MNPSTPHPLLNSQLYIHTVKSQYSYPHMAVIPSTRSLSCDWSLVSSKGSSPQTENQFFFFQIPVSSVSLKLTSCCLYLPPFLHKSDWEGSSYARCDQSVSLPSFYCKQDVPFFLDFFILHTKCQIDLFHPSPVPHLKTYKVFMVQFPQRPICNTIQSCAPKMQHFIRFFLKFKCS